MQLHGSIDWEIRKGGYYFRAASECAWTSPVIQRYAESNHGAIKRLTAHDPPKKRQSVATGDLDDFGLKPCGIFLDALNVFRVQGVDVI